MNNEKLHTILYKISREINRAADFYELTVEKEQSSINNFYYRITDKELISVEVFVEFAENAIKCKLVTYFYRNVNYSNKERLIFILNSLKQDFKNYERIELKKDYMFFIKYLDLGLRVNDNDKIKLLMNLIDIIMLNIYMEGMIEATLKELYELPEDIRIN